MTTSSTDNGQSLTDNKQANQSANGFASLQIITSACHGILNTNFTAPEKKPDWFDALQLELDAAKVLANEWIDDIAPTMTSKIPNHIIDYSTTYDATTDEILNQLDQNEAYRKTNGKDDPAAVQNVSDLIQALEQAASGIIKDMDDINTRLTTWGDKMQKSHDNLFKGTASIQKAEIDLQADIEKMNNAIAGLNAEIDLQRKAIAGAGIAIGVGLLMLVAGVALCIATAGTAAVAAGVVAGLGAAAVIGGAVTWGVMQSKIDTELGKIADDNKKIADDKRQIVALQGLTLATNGAVSSIAIATSALSDVKVMWKGFQGEIQGTLDKLKKGEEALRTIVKKVDIKAARKEWKLAEEFAQKLLGQGDAKLEAKTEALIPSVPAAA
ncbi:MAG: non-hemolytic enterotoxin lytic component L1 [Microcystis wesenbergii Mw_MB_S_20031200_S109]|uniref:Non-hemolytic enterotoxin lytic component L1 n=1 Tax=Microcystis wesenbergii Mw_MB_S_20031200_S109D TaxID=2486241 RepID=A0A552LMM5_9CHRO|nr:MAG: non-hemolytic enterotoxin lytic component L1 [Microcystis wesenbergii Mw_MB_S_20031200_S109]TRV21459.1 MAG: non-hemolytic enterotoxin lytic component L1 [Microcystis wesenbergii Mw_MB_S_20031200_S109D]